MSPADDGVVPRPGASLLVVALGGALGSLARHGVGLTLDDRPGWAAVLVNVTGAFALGWLVARLAGRRAPRARLLLGTGLLGGWTTYSGFALDVVTAAGDGHVLRSFVLVAVTLVAGLAACVAGVRLGARTARSRTSGALS